jgi:hypothetical protein
MLLLAVAPAHASYPGRNGLIAYGIVRLGTPADPYNWSDEIDVASPGAASPKHTIAYCGEQPETLAIDFSAPAFSPDGREIAFSQWNASCSPPLCCALRITIERTDGTGRHTLPRLTTHDRSPEFLPGGRTLVFAGRPPRSSRYDLFSVGVHGNGLRRLTYIGADQPARVRRRRDRVRPRG